MADPDPDRHLKKVLNVIGVSTKIGNVVQLVKRRRGSPPKITEEQEIQQRLEKSKEARSERLNILATKHRHVLEVGAYILAEDQDYAAECVADRMTDVQLLDSFFEPEGVKALLLFHGMRPPPGMDTGRYNAKMKQDTNQVWITDGRSGKVTVVCVGVCRHSNVKPIETKGLSDEILFTYIAIPEECSIVYSLVSILEKVLKPAIDHIRDYGHCNDVQKSNFKYGVNRFINFLKSTEKDISQRIVFDLDRDLYLGFLLTAIQVQETARDRERMGRVEQIFSRWMEQVQYALTQGDQIEQAPHYVGPLVELEYWRTILTRYTSISEFTESKVFLQFLESLKISRGKLVKVWEGLAAELSNKLIESRDNVRFISSIERFWDPLYRCEPQEATRSIPSLLEVIRHVYKSSMYYNTSDRITGLLTKIANQIIINCRLYLTDRGTIRIYHQPKQVLITKITICHNLDAAFRSSYNQTVQKMTDSPTETPWECSQVFVFGKLNHFKLRLARILEIMEIYLKYEIIDHVAISGTEIFSGRIKAAYETLTSKPYDPLIYTEQQFDTDYECYLKEVETAELELVRLQLNKAAILSEIHPLIVTTMQLQGDCCDIIPSLEDVQFSFERVVLNVVETFYAISTWGRQAKSAERKTRRPVLAEQRAERDWFKLISEHKEVTRMVHEFDGGMLLLKPDISYVLKQVYNHYEYLWKQNLFTVTLESKPELFEKIKEDLAAVTYSSHIGPIVIKLDAVVELVLRRFFAFYNIRIEEIVDFITKHDETLKRTLVDLDDIRMAMDCLQMVQ
uniref:Dynein heavy chain tail domain-containing protein n=1 Tax=Anopheles maculatus TaxID=74869 RepID=A0A182SSL6_9DIPT